MMQHSKTKDVDIQKFQLVTKHSTQLKEGIVSNVILIDVIVIKNLFYYVVNYYYTDLFIMRNNSFRTKKLK